jgi:hypothetical protein
MPKAELVILVAALTLGGGLLVASLALYQTRTHDEKFWTRFWLSRGLLTRQEYRFNRIGFAICVLAIVMLGVHTLLLLHRHH